MRLVRRAHKRLTLTALDNVQKESEQYANIGVTVLLNQNQVQLLMLVQFLSLLHFARNMLADSGNDLRQLLFVFWEVEFHEHLLDRLLKILLIWLGFLSEAECLGQRRIRLQVVQYFVC